MKEWLSHGMSVRDTSISVCDSSADSEESSSFCTAYMHQSLHSEHRSLTWKTYFGIAVIVKFVINK